MNLIVALLILISSTASIPLSIKWTMHPEVALLYNKANMSRVNIQRLSVLLGVGGVLILLPQTFVLGGTLLIIHSSITIGCYYLTRDWKGGAIEFALLQIPIAMIFIGYPLSLLEWARRLLH